MLTACSVDFVLMVQLLVHGLPQSRNARLACEYDEAEGVVMELHGPTSYQAPPEIGSEALQGQHYRAA